MSKVPELKTGMVLERRNGDKVVVYTNTFDNKDIISYERGDGWDFLDGIFDRETLNYKYSVPNPSLDVVKIYTQRITNGHIRKGYKEIIKEAKTLLWERIEAKTDMTIEAIEAKLGYSITIVGEK